MTYVNVFDNDSRETFNEHLCKDNFSSVSLTKKPFIYS